MTLTFWRQYGEHTFGHEKSLNKIYSQVRSEKLVASKNKEAQLFYSRPHIRTEFIIREPALADPSSTFREHSSSCQDSRAYRECE